MARNQRMTVNSPVGRSEVDATGSAVGVVRMDPSRSYAGTGELLQRYINQSSEAAWQEIKTKIDYTFEHLDHALAALDGETGFGRATKQRVAKGQRLLFKPNLVNPLNIDPETRGPGAGSTTCTEWPFMAALMRWFHDRAEISYHAMSVGEAATLLPAAAGLCSMLHPQGKRVTPEAVIEGRSGDFYGGWGFYFVRKYLAESHDASHSDDPMQGYDDSVAGTYVPPGRAGNRLQVVDLNRIFDDTTKGRDIEVSDGANFSSITLHKAIVGGDPADAADREAYPGCVLINVPKLKVHAITLLTNVIKNLGIGLYPMQAAGAGHFQWDYSVPHNAVPGMKAGIPHQVWVPEIDPATSLPRRESDGRYTVQKTAGIPGTMVDIVKAVANQGIFMVHVVDGIEAINRDHTGTPMAAKVAEGLAVAGLDPVATDLLCARYLFGNVPISEAEAAGLEDGHGGRFAQRVPVPLVDGGNIVTQPGHDCALSRDTVFQYAEARGLGKRTYYVVGKDAVIGSPLVSLQGHLGTVREGTFSDVTTHTMYYDVYKIPWDLQRTALSYFEAVDHLAGSSLKQEFLQAFDEDGDGVVSYEETGKKGVWSPLLLLGGAQVSTLGTERLGYSRGGFDTNATLFRCSNPSWNADGHDLYKEFMYGPVCLAAYTMSLAETEAPDPFRPSLIWGKGKWPSFQLAAYAQLGIGLYGDGFPSKVGVTGLYGQAFLHADLVQNDGRYVGGSRSQPDPDAVTRYVTDVLGGQTKPLDFVLFVPPGLGNVGGSQVPNVVETSEPEKILTASFAGGREVWPATVR